MLQTIESLTVILDLGMKSLSFLEVAEAEEIKWEILDKFPKLNNAGGFELLRVDGKQRCLEVIPIPRGGYTVIYFKDVIQQAKVYIRPIQSIHIPYHTYIPYQFMIPINMP